MISEQKFYELNPSDTCMAIGRIPIVRYFPQVFPKELSGMPPEREIVFEIQLKKQLDELLEKG